MSGRWILWSKEGYDVPARAAVRTTHEGHRPLVRRGNSPSTAITTVGGNGADSRTGSDPQAAIQSPHGGPAVSADEQKLVGDIIDRRAIDVAFQPILDAVGDHIVGFEAFLRGPEGLLASPMRLLAAARAVGRAGELDWVARTTAFRKLLDSDLPPSVSLFMNIDPDSLLSPCPDDLLETVWAAQSRLRVFVEITEAMLRQQPVLVLKSVRRARRAGWGVAMDNTGYGATGLALLPVIAPDVIKLDRQLLAEGAGYASAAMAAASRERARTGAALVIERFEHDFSVPLGEALGAGFRQGRALAVEGVLPRTVAVPPRPVPLLARPNPDQTAPWEALAASPATISRTTRTGMNELVKHLLSDAFSGSVAPVVSLVLPRGHANDMRNVPVYRMLLERSPLQIVLAAESDLPGDWRLWRAQLPEDHPWDNALHLVAVSDGGALSLAARPERGTPFDERYEILYSHRIDTALDQLERILTICD